MRCILSNVSDLPGGFSPDDLNKTAEHFDYKCPHTGGRQGIPQCLKTILTHFSCKVIYNLLYITIFQVPVEGESDQLHDRNGSLFAIPVSVTILSTDSLKAISFLLSLFPSESKMICEKPHGIAIFSFAAVSFPGGIKSETRALSLWPFSLARISVPCFAVVFENDTRAMLKSAESSYKSDPTWLVAAGFCLSLPETDATAPASFSSGTSSVFWCSAAKSSGVLPF